MGAILRVDPDRLRSAAEAQTAVSTFLADMAPGRSLTTAGSGVPGLLSEGACRLATSVLDAATAAARDELTTHTRNLSAAADQYRRVDAELGRRLRTFAG